MAYVYMIKDEKKNNCLFKIGYASCLDKRFMAYSTENPNIECIGFVTTKSQSKQRVETAYHKEIKECGFEFVSSFIGARTEWFKVEYTDPAYKRLCEEGLNFFQTSKNRKVKEYK